MNWLSTATDEVKKIEADVKGVVVSDEHEALNAVADFQAATKSGVDRLLNSKNTLEASIKRNQDALDAVNAELAKAQSLVPPQPVVQAE